MIIDCGNWDLEIKILIENRIPQPDLSGNPFLWLEKIGQKDWERKADKAAQIFKL